MSAPPDDECVDHVVGPGMVNPLRSTKRAQSMRYFLHDQLLEELRRLLHGFFERPLQYGQCDERYRQVDPEAEPVGEARDGKWARRRTRTT